MAHIEEFKLVAKAQKGASGLAVYGQLKEEMWRETVTYLEDVTEESIREERRALKEGKERAKREARVEQWEVQRGGEKAKL